MTDTQDIHPIKVQWDSAATELIGFLSSRLANYRQEPVNPAIAGPWVCLPAVLLLELVSDHVQVVFARMARRTMGVNVVLPDLPPELAQVGLEQDRLTMPMLLSLLCYLQETHFRGDELVSRLCAAATRLAKFVIASSGQPQPISALSEEYFRLSDRLISLEFMRAIRDTIARSSGVIVPNPPVTGPSEEPSQ
jgi:hypothetical protein